MVKADFCDKSFLYRLKTSGKNQMLPKACGLHLGYKTIIDATGGLGEDGFLLAHLGFEVSMCERNKTIYDSLKNALELARHEPDLKAAASRITLHYGDANTLLTKLDPPDVIYLDPMFPERKKSALVKQSMRDLKKIVGDDPDADTLLISTLKIKAKRVVVKRPKLAPPLGGTKPSFEVKGKSGRFDVYLF